MKLRVHPLPLISLVIASIVLGTFKDLAGPGSSLIAVFLPALGISSLLHLAFSWQVLAFHQDFSTDHPQKGERVVHKLHITNQSPLPLAPGLAFLADTGTLPAAPDGYPLPALPHTRIDVQEDILCAWRGIYVAGLERLVMRDILSLVTIEEHIEPRVFYVYPEVISLDPRVEDLALASGADREGRGTETEDVSIFEYLAPLSATVPARRISWKHWAKYGEPVAIVHGQSRSAGLSIVLDLWPGLAGNEKLAAEDRAVSALFSLLKHFARDNVATRVCLAGKEPLQLEGLADYEELYDHSTGILADRDIFPDEAFGTSGSTLLITTRPLAQTAESGQAELFGALREAYSRGTAPHTLLCPPPSFLLGERHAVGLLEELRNQTGSQSLLAIADSTRGVQELSHVLIP